MKEQIAVIGLGYVGLPVAVAFGSAFAQTRAFDIDETRIAELRRGIDRNGDVSEEACQKSNLHFTNLERDLTKTTFFVVAVPTPVDENNRPDLRALENASKTVGRALTKGAVVVYESTVYPGITEEFCAPILETASGLKAGGDFKLGYSPERINPGDREHSLENVVKIVSGQDTETLDRVANVYGRIVSAGIHRAPSIKVAEAAKVIENTQRDLNIALMNELSLIFDRMGIATRDVLAAAKTKWNFLSFSPGLVGGHCIGVDPYYLTTIAEQLGYHPQVILAGRRINDGMGHFIAQKTIKLMVNAGFQIKGSRVGILGITFKENISDIRNSRIPSIADELSDFGAQPLIHDPHADEKETNSEYGITLRKWNDLRNLEALILAVPHRKFLALAPNDIFSLIKPNGVLIDIKSVLSRENVRPDLSYWSL